MLTQFDRVIGLDRLRALHLNDSKNPCGSHKDRHEQIGKGFLGIETFRRIVNHPALRGLPMFLETPNDLSGYQEEIALLRSWSKRQSKMNIRKSTASVKEVVLFYALSAAQQGVGILD